MKRLIVVYNANSSRYTEVEEEVLVPLRKMPGWLVGKYAIKSTNYQDNVSKLGNMLSDGDLMVVAGGDGTASIAINSILQSGKDVTIGALGFGNFNDIASMLGMDSLAGIMERINSGKTAEIYPLEILVNDELWRYAPCYATVGLLAQATTVMEDKKVRKRLRTGRKRTVFSLLSAVKWYFGHHWGNYLPAGKYNGVPICKKATDYLAVNGPYLAHIMKGGDWYCEKRSFGSTVERLGSFWRMIKFGLRSINKGIALQEARADVLEFDQPSNVGVQTEGEFTQLEHVKVIRVQKSKIPLKVISAGCS